jgi:hypothetical protein
LRWFLYFFLQIFIRHFFRNKIDPMPLNILQIIENKRQLHFMTLKDFCFFIVNFSYVCSNIPLIYFHQRNGGVKNSWAGRKTINKHFGVNLYVSNDSIRMLLFCGWLTFRGRWLTNNLMKPKFYYNNLVWGQDFAKFNVIITISYANTTCSRSKAVRCVLYQLMGRLLAHPFR